MSALRPLSAPDGGEVAVCPHCWQVNVGAERLCGRCGADMTLLLQESGGLRRTPAVQSPVPVRASQRLGPLARVALLVMTALLALAWVVAPLLGGARIHRSTAGRRDGETAGSRRPSAPGKGRFGLPGAAFAPVQRKPVAPSRRPAVSQSTERRPGAGTVTTKGRV